MTARVRSTNSFGADCFELTLALDPDGTFWSQEAPIDVDVRFRLDPSAGYVSVLQGRVDSVRLDAISRVVQIQGRDHSSALIDSVVSETFSNRTASEIAMLLARRHGLQSAIVPTSDMVGRYYRDEHDTVSLDTFCGRASEWDLLAHLAQHEGYDLFVVGTTLNFLPASSLTGVSCTLTPNDVIELRLERNLPFAGEIEVVVKTWNSRQQVADAQVARRAGNRLSGSTTLSTQEIRRFTLVRPNLTSDAAQQLAERRLAELCVHSSAIDIVMPGELALMPRGVILLSGTGTDFDQVYRIDVVDRRLSSQSGFVQRVRASNMSNS